MIFHYIAALLLWSAGGLQNISENQNKKIVDRVNNSSKQHVVKQKEEGLCSEKYMLDQTAQIVSSMDAEDLKGVRDAIDGKMACLHYRRSKTSNSTKISTFNYLLEYLNTLQEYLAYIPYSGLRTEKLFWQWCLGQLAKEEQSEL